MSAADNFKKQLGEEIAQLFTGEFKFQKSKLELKRRRADGFDVIVLSGSNKWSPYIDVSFYFGRNYDAARKIERDLGSFPMHYHIQQYSLNVRAMKGLICDGDGSWEVNLQDPPANLASQLKAAIEEIAFPFFERFSTITEAQKALSDNDTWCFSPRGPFFHMIFKVDAALNDIEHFKKWSQCLDEPYREQANQEIAKYEASRVEI